MPLFPVFHSYQWLLTGAGYYVGLSIYTYTYTHIYIYMYMPNQVVGTMIYWGIDT